MTSLLGGVCAFSVLQLLPQLYYRYNIIGIIETTLSALKLFIFYSCYILYTLQLDRVRLEPAVTVLAAAAALPAPHSKFILRGLLPSVCPRLNQILMHLESKDVSCTASSKLVPLGLFRKVASSNNISRST